MDKENIFKEEPLKETEKTLYSGCNKCDAGYIDGLICDCLKFEIMQRKYYNSNIDYDFASLSLIEEEVEAYLKNGDDKIKISINKFINTYVNNSKENRKSGMGILFNGPTGRGKSLSAMKILMLLVEKGYKCYFITIKQYIEIVKKSWTDEEYKKKLDYIHNCDFMVMDDLGTEYHKDGNDWALTEIDGLFRHRYYKKLPTIMTTNSKIEQLESKYAQRIISLFHERLMFVPIVSKEDFRKKSAKIPSYINIEEIQ